MGCASASSITVYQLPRGSTSTSKITEACTTFSRVDSITEVPDDVFFAFLRLGKIARNNGSHMETVGADGRRSLRRADLWASEVPVSQRSRRANALRPSVTFQLPAAVDKGKFADDATEHSCSTAARTEGATEDTCSSLLLTERSGGASDFDDLSRQGSTELSTSDIEASLWGDEDLNADVSSELSASEVEARSDEASEAPRSPPPTVRADAAEFYAVL